MITYLIAFIFIQANTTIVLAAEQLNNKPAAEQLDRKPAAQQLDNKQTTLTLNETNYESIFLEKSSVQTDIELSEARSQYNFELLNTKYNVTTSLDAYQQKDKTESVSSFLKQDSDLFKLTWLTSKRFTTGTNLSLEYTEQHPTNRTSPATTTTEYYQKYFTVAAEQNLFPFLAERTEKSAFKASEYDLQSNQLQNKLNQISAVNDFSQLFWSTVTLKKSIDENQKLLTQYEKLVKTVRGKSNFNYANAGELEQALAEYETRIQNLNSDRNQYNDNINKIRQKLLLDENTNLNLEFKNTNLPKPEVKMDIPVEQTAQYRIQNLKKLSAEESLKSLRFSNAPQMSVYGKYTQSGADVSTTEASFKMGNSDYQKYIIGLKLDYTFGNDKNTQDQLIKAKTAKIEADKAQISLEQVRNEYNQAADKLNQIFQQIDSQRKVVEYRQKASEQIFKNYSQGRTDISNLIDAYNRKLNAELTLIKLYSDFSSAQIQLRNYQVR